MLHLHIQPRDSKAAVGDTLHSGSFSAKGEAKSSVALEHTRLADAEEAERMKAFWRERLAALGSQVAGGGIDA